jgi:D-xylonolactonase
MDPDIIPDQILARSRLQIFQHIGMRSHYEVQPGNASAVESTFLQTCQTPRWTRSDINPSILLLFNMKNTSPVSLWPIEAELGEGVLWHEAGHAVYCVDVKKRKIHRCDEHGHQRKTWEVPEQIGFILPSANGNFICGLQSGLHDFSPADGTFTRINQIDIDYPHNRLNDGYADQHGFIWFGTMDDNETASSGTLYSMSSAGAVVAHDSNYVITNGPAVSPDGRTLYHTDTVNKSIYAFDIEPDHSLSNKRLFVQIGAAGHPDGMAVDSAGNVWVALFGGWRIDRFSPLGELIGTVAFPCANVTKLAFGGEDLCTAFVTTARKGLTAEECLAQPLAGNLFSFRTDTPGLPQPVFKPEF